MNHFKKLDNHGFREIGKSASYIIGTWTYVSDGLGGESYMKMNLCITLDPSYFSCYVDGDVYWYYVSGEYDTSGDIVERLDEYMSDPFFDIVLAKVVMKVEQGEM